MSSIKDKFKFKFNLICFRLTFYIWKIFYIHYCVIITIRDVDDINGRKVCDWWLLMASTARIIMIAMRDVDDINGRKVCDWWHSSRLLSALRHLMASTSRIMIAMRDVVEIKGRKECDLWHPCISEVRPLMACTSCILRVMRDVDEIK